MSLRIPLGILLTLVVVAASGQDTRYAPRGQQIPAPDCMNLHFAWEGPQVTCPSIHA